MINQTTGMWYMFALTALFACMADDGAAKADEKPVSVRLVSTATVIAAGEPFEVGVRIEHGQGYHTYWSSPGTVGLATQVTWTLPEGFTVSELAWPPPERCLMEGYNTHGYERDVTLVATITPPANAPAEPVAIQAQAAWMACAKEKCCNVQFEKLTLTLPVAATASPDPAGAKLIADSRAQFAKSAPFLEASFNQSRDSFILNLRFAKAQQPHLPPPTEVYFFAEGLGVDTTVDQQVARTDSGYRITLKRTDFGPKDPETLTGLLHAPSGWPGDLGAYLTIVAKATP